MKYPAEKGKFVSVPLSSVYQMPHDTFLPHGLSIYKSSAGSGKTYTLVREYLRLVMASPRDYRHILTLTFTNKAAGEMKDRIVEALVQLSRGENPTLASDLAPLCPDGHTAERASVILSNILHDYSAFSVSTIDSFFNRLIRALAKELRLPLRYEVEMDQEKVVLQVTDMLLQDVGKDADLSEWLKSYLSQRLGEERSWNMEQDIASITRELFKEHVQQSNVADFPPDKHFVGELFSIRNNFEQTMRRFGEQAAKTLTAHNLTANDFAYGKTGVGGYLLRLAHEKKTDLEPTLRVRQAAENPESWYTKKAANKELLAEIVRDTLRPLVCELLRFYESEKERYYSAIEVYKMVYLYGILHRLSEKLTQYRDEQKVMLISDIARLLAGFVQASDTPFIYEKIGTRYKHILLDEFQDTSDFQWKNIMPLVINSLSEGNLSMVVGDAKQSIYRWRGGNMSLLLEGIKSDLSGFNSILKEEKLSTNYRSKKNIVSFNNHLFSAITQVAGAEGNLALAYDRDDLTQLTAERNSEGGCVSLTFLHAKTKSNHGEEAEEKGWKEEAVARTVALVTQLREEGYRQNDISILVRTNIEGNTIASALFSAGYTKIISPDSLLLSNSPVIGFLVDVFRFLADRNNQIARAHILHFYLFSLADELPNNPDLHAVFADYRHRPSENNLFEQPSLFFQFLPEAFSHHLDFLSRLPLYEITEHLIRIFRLNARPDAYIQRFQDIILEYSASNKADIGDFTDWWDKNKDREKCSLIVPEGEDGIRITTIHKSKGLQFPVVIVPFANWKVTPDSRDVMWVSAGEAPFNRYPLLPVKPGQSLSRTMFSEQYNQELQQALADNINLLYVAFTRPEDRLYSFAPYTEKEQKNNVADLLLQTIRSSGPLQQHWNDEQKELRIMVAEKKAFDTKKRTSLSALPLTEYHSSHWQSKITISRRAKDPEAMLETPRASKINYGVLLHRILAGIQHPLDVERVIKRIVAEGMITPEEIAELLEKVNALLGRDEVKRWFEDPSWDVRVEQELILPGGEIVRPDRVLLKEGHAVVIDFKTGIPRQGDEEQVRKYADTLRLAGYRNVEKYLLYTGTGEVREVSE